MNFDYDTYYLTDLKAGSHASPDEGACLLELTALFAREKFSDHPKCVSPVLRLFGRSLNDVLPNGLRQELKTLIPSLPGTAGDGMDERRRFMVLDWLLRTWLPTWLDLVPATREGARALRELDRVHDAATTDRAVAAAREAFQAARAAWKATGATGATEAAQEAAWDAARNVGEAAAWAASQAATARSIAEAGVAVIEAGVAARTVTAVAILTGAAVLAPTVAQLQQSAITLYAEMVKAPR